MNEVFRRIGIVWYGFSCAAMGIILVLGVLDEKPRYDASNISIMDPASGAAAAILFTAVVAFSAEASSNEEGGSIFRPDIVSWPLWISLMIFPLGLGLGIIFTFFVHMAYFGGSHGFFETLAFKTSFIGPFIISIGTGLLASILIFIPLQLLAWIFSGYSSGNR